MANNNRPRRDDELANIPTMTPARDELGERRRNPQPRPSGGGGGGFGSIVALVVALAASGAAYYLWDQQQAVIARAEQAEQRLASLESQLASTGDELSQSDAAVRVKLKELDTEVRKLWDNVWKRSKETLANHDKQLAALEKSSKTLGSSQAELKTQLQDLRNESTRVAAMLDDMGETLADIERVGRDALTLADQVAELRKQQQTVDRQLADHEEWLQSINTFRQQVNQQLNSQNQPATSNPTLQ